MVDAIIRPGSLHPGVSAVGCPQAYEEQTQQRQALRDGHCEAGAKTLFVQNRTNPGKTLKHAGAWLGKKEVFLFFFCTELLACELLPTRAVGIFLSRRFGRRWVARKRPYLLENAIWCEKPWESCPRATLVEGLDHVGRRP